MTATMADIVKLPPRRDVLEDFWLRLEISFEFLRDDGDSNLLRILMRDDYARLATWLEADTAMDPARWAMLRYALDVCKD